MSSKIPPQKNPQNCKDQHMKTEAINFLKQQNPNKISFKKHPEFSLIIPNFIHKSFPKNCYCVALKVAFLLSLALHSNTIYRILSRSIYKSGFFFKYIFFVILFFWMARDLMDPTSNFYILMDIDMKKRLKIRWHQRFWIHLWIDFLSVLLSLFPLPIQR